LTLKNTTVNIYEDEDGGVLGLLPSTIDLMEAEMLPRGREGRLRTFLNTHRDAYDIILIDCPPTISMFTLSAYLASDAYLVPLKPDPLSTVGLPLLEGVISEYAANHGHTIDQIGVVFTMVRKTNLMKNTMQEVIASRGGAVFNNYLSMSTYVADAVTAHKPLFLYPRAKKFGRQIELITDELAVRLGWS
jgi:chromosome partitioning protein